MCEAKPRKRKVKMLRGKRKKEKRSLVHNVSYVILEKKTEK
jgi:phenylpyruvate tautomerase PptA (4-oxalocrotonate tautomerase family)